MIENKWKSLSLNEIQKYNYIENSKESIKWITTEWLETHLNSENLIIVDSQPHFMDYIESHIPRSI